ncbi:Pescadillo N-terminus-domain-containing protein [Entophlyctis helioformis]|nr:Pescadillo N-terminus-domain-containing protein [Entophlyctis helioformis]
MGTKQKKGEVGNAVKYMARSQAIRKLQITLAQFRRLCILKGIYPVEPRNKRAVTKGSTALRTYYYRKDIQFLLHEPVLQVIREQKVHLRKISKAIGKKQYSVVKTLREAHPEYTLDHIVKERYPTFVDALRDLDDALSMIFLFATLPVDDKIPAAHIRECQRLSAEFQHFVLMSGSLKRVFLSIKGIYYQAEIRGQDITWITPYQFSQAVPSDVDFRVMGTFLELYETLLGFVNYKLYSDLGLVYPPKIDLDRDANAGGLAAFILESKDQSGVVQSIAATSSALSALTASESEQVKQSAKRIKTLKKKLSKIQDGEENGASQSNGQDEDEDEDNDADAMDMDVPMPVVNPTSVEETVPTLATSATSKRAAAAGGNGQTLFASCVFWLSREVPRYSLEFVIKALGGQVGWDETAGVGSPYTIDDPRITHHIVDRPVTSVGELPVGTERVAGREYIQPQWVYDSINAGKLVKTAGYHPGETLPPHLSPFVTVREGDYVPEEAGGEAVELVDDDAVMAAEAAAAVEEEDEEAAHQAELDAEAAGINYSEYNAGDADANADANAETDAPVAAKKRKPAAGKGSKGEVSADPKKEEAEQKEMAKMLMSKKHLRLYNKMQFGNKRKADAANNLKQKKVALLKKEQKSGKKQ